MGGCSKGGWTYFWENRPHTARANCSLYECRTTTGVLEWQGRTQAILETFKSHLQLCATSIMLDDRTHTWRFKNVKSSVYTLHIWLIAPCVHVNYYWYIQSCSSSSVRAQQFLYLTTVHRQSSDIIFFVCLQLEQSLTGIIWIAFLTTSSCCFNTNTIYAWYKSTKFTAITAEMM